MATGGQNKVRQGLPSQRIMQRLAGFSIAFFLVACTPQDARTPAVQDASQATRLFTIGYQDISNIYIDDVTVPILATAGLNGLTDIDPKAAITQNGKQFTLSLDGAWIGNFNKPDPKDADGWGNMTAAVVNMARSRSEKLEAADPEKIYEAVFDGALNKLDKFSRYAGRDEARENRASRDGFGGIGVRIRLIDEGVKILSVMQNTPAERVGLIDNDIITAIDDEPTVGLSQREVVRRLRGPLRSQVQLTIFREGADAALNLEVVRAHIVPQTVKYKRLGKIGVMRVSGFNQSTTRTLREKIKQAQNEIGPGMDGFILDLRGNPGGLLDQAVAVSDVFVTQGRIVSTHGRHPDSHQYFDAAPDDLAKNLPVVVLVNGNSASASEIVAAALQDAERAIVVGSSSYGKGTVQTVLRLPNEGELTLTWARFHAPSGYALNQRGVLPDICTTIDVETAEDVMQKLRNGQLPIDRATQRRKIPAGNAASVEALRAICPARQDESEIDIEVAQRLLENPELFARAHGGELETVQLGTDQSAVAPLNQ